MWQKIIVFWKWKDTIHLKVTMWNCWLVEQFKKLFQENRAKTVSTIWSQANEQCINIDLAESQLNSSVSRWKVGQFGGFIICVVYFLFPIPSFLVEPVKTELQSACCTRVFHMTEKYYCSHNIIHSAWISQASRHWTLSEFFVWGHIMLSIFKSNSLPVAVNGEFCLKINGAGQLLVPKALFYILCIVSFIWISALILGKLMKN